MGTSLAMTDATDGHLALDADERERALLDDHDRSFWGRSRDGAGTLATEKPAQQGSADERT